MPLSGYYQYPFPVECKPMRMNILTILATVVSLMPRADLTQSEGSINMFT